MQQQLKAFPLEKHICVWVSKHTIKFQNTLQLIINPLCQPQNISFQNCLQFPQRSPYTPPRGWPPNNISLPRPQKVGRNNRKTKQPSKRGQSHKKLNFKLKPLRRTEQNTSQFYKPQGHGAGLTGPDYSHKTLFPFNLCSLLIALYLLRRMSVLFQKKH